MKCAAHPEVETNLSCGRCGIPICPRCLVQTPVGARCRKCANLKRLPTFEISPQQYVRATLMGVGLAAAIGIAWSWFWGAVSLFNFLVAAGVGYAIAEVLSLSVNRKRGRGLQVIAAVCVVISYVIGNVGLSSGVLTFFAGFDLYDLLVPAFGIVVAVVRLQ
ncbi:MAG: hypothetical protein DRI39_05840 [Chloroflexi bacterium]|nr:MAG: hypothetical protein DRI39_05840 [Chloroflexota bacterium]